MNKLLLTLTLALIAGFAWADGDTYTTETNCLESRCPAGTPAAEQAAVVSKAHTRATSYTQCPGMHPFGYINCVLGSTDDKTVIYVKRLEGVDNHTDFRVIFDTANESNKYWPDSNSYSYKKFESCRNPTLHADFNDR